MRFDLDRAAFAGEPVTEAGPGPVFGLLDQTACDRIPVDIAQLFHPLGMGEHIEVVVAGLPELFREPLRSLDVSPFNTLIVVERSWSFGSLRSR